MPCDVIPSCLIENEWGQTVCCTVLSGSSPTHHLHNLDHFSMLTCHKHCDNCTDMSCKLVSNMDCYFPPVILLLLLISVCFTRQIKLQDMF